MKIDIPIILTVSSFLVFLGLWGILRHRNDLMRLILALQFVFLGAIFNFALGSALSKDLTGIAFALFVSCLTGVQMTASLTLFLIYFRRHSHLNTNQINQMKG